MNYSNKIQELRVFFNETNSGLERMWGLSNGYLSKFEKNKIENPSKLIIALVSNGISIDWFFNDTGSITTVSSLGGLAHIKKIEPSSPVAKAAENYIKKHPELIKAQEEEEKRGLELYHKNQLNRDKPEKRLDNEKILHEKARNKASTLPDTPAGGTIETQRQNPPGVPLIYAGDSGLNDGIVIPLLENAASAGYGEGLDEDDVPARYVQVPRYLSKYPHLASLPVKGDSMEPTLHDGDLVVCDGGGWDGDGIYVLKTYDTAYVKRVQLSTDGYKVISDNKMYDSFTESVEKLSIVGKVRAILVIVPGRRGGV